MLFRMILIKKNVHVKTFLLIFITICTNNHLFSNYIFNENHDSILDANYIYRDKIFDKNIKTVLCFKKNQNLSIPLINLKSDEKISLIFDDHGDNIRTFFYRIIHCNSNWEKSDLIESDYIDGFFKNEIYDYELSFNTIQKYINYNLELPNEDISFLKSGNYIVEIINELDSIIFHKRFMILEKKVSISANIKQGTLNKNKKIKHEIDFHIHHEKFYISDPYTDVKVIVKQNNNEENKIDDLSPLFVKNNVLIYDYDDENNFFAINEFRYFDIRSLRYLSEKIKYIKHDSIDKINKVFLFKDKKRAFDLYSIYPDINGKFIIESQEGRNSMTESDYAKINFKLISEKIEYGDIYIFGKLSDWMINDNFKLKYNEKEKIYETDIILKQGYYNYNYALKDTINNTIDFSFIEGTHYQTKNDYYIYVYYRGSENRYDMLIGFLKTSSKELF